MDRSMKVRNLERMTVTKLIERLEEEIKTPAVNNLEISASLQGLEAHALKLAELDEEVKLAMLEQNTPEDVLQQEFDTVEEYAHKITLMRLKVNSVNYGTAGSDHVHAGSGSVSTVEKRNFCLPKIELKKFSGELIDWLGWWAQFKKIDEDDSIHAADKFTYLIQSMKEGSRAHDVVKRFPPSTENYPKAVEALKERYGKKKLLKQVYVRELIKMILDNRAKEKTPLSVLVDRLESSLLSLASLDVSTDQMVEFLFPMVESSLPEDTLLAWQRSSFYGRDGTKESPAKSELDLLMQVLKVEIENEEQRKLARSGFGMEANDRKHQKWKHSNAGDEATAAGLFSGSDGGKPRVSCLFCGRSHKSHECRHARAMTLDERRAKLLENSALFTCLKFGHFARTCKAPVRCSKCSGNHHFLLCPQFSSRSEHRNVASEGPTFQSNINCTSHVLLRTLMVKVVNPTTRRTRIVRALIDCGSQGSYILEKTAHSLGLKVKETLKVNHLLFGGSVVRDQSHKVYDLCIGSVRGKFSFPVTVMDQPRLCGHVPRIHQGQLMVELRKKGIHVSDVYPHHPMEIEVLIGADYLGDLLTGGQVKLDNGLAATETRLGWTLMGRQKSGTALAMSVLSMTISSATVEDLWRLETLGIMDPTEVKSQEQKEAEAQAYFKRTVKRNDEGRYSVSLPWIGDNNLPSNEDVAFKRLVSTTKRLCSTHKYQAYDAIFKEWETEGIISLVERKDQTDQGHFLPHRAVFKDSKTTPVRPVFDASCRVGRSLSLNDCLEKGPNFLELIPSLLLRFRMGRIGVIADIRKAFLMIDVNEQDRKFLRFLWWDDLSKEKVKVYQHNRVVFGMNCSPFLLAAVINYHTSLMSALYPDVVRRIQKSVYVDNLVTAVDSLEEYEKVKEVATGILQEAKMDLRQWERTGVSGDNEVTGVLGLKWDKVKDELFCEPIPGDLPLKMTKRTILSQIQKCYDPLGFLSPTLIVPKVLLQTAWIENKRWDEQVSKEMEVQFRKWWEELSIATHQIRVPRYCKDSLSGNEKLQIHTFCDASKRAYGAVVFLRVENMERVTVHFLQAKTRVAPVKQITIPRMELLSCTIASRLTHSIREALNMMDAPVYYWNDSTTALAWIKRRSDWGVFVGNRVKEILSLTESSNWRHIPGNLNPADLPSRGISPVKFAELRWWEGPDWLRLTELEWPESNPEVDEEAVNRERLKKISTLIVSTVSSLWYYRTNSYIQNLKIMAFVLRFVKAARTRMKEKQMTPTVEEINRTELKLFELVQRESFPKDESVVSGLKIEKDEAGIIRVKTKLLYRMDSEGFRWPILLPNCHPLVDSMIMEEHIQNHHGGIQFLLGRLREKVWIIQGRKAIKKVIRSCVRCRRFEAGKREVPSCALPENRVKDATAFEVTGVDLAGPLMLKNRAKVYIVLFTCAVYRCVHLELSESLSTEDFLLAFHRFCSRKRRPKIVYSDNGTNFKGAVSLFKEIDWKKVEEQTKQRRITWIFNPPSAPWWGGWWERLIRSVKDLLKRMLGTGRLTYVELETCLCEAESVVNHRPLTCVTEDQEDLIPLTPSMFITCLPISEVPESELFTSKSLGRKRQNLKKLIQELRGRFRKEYLGQLVQRGKEQAGRAFKVGDVVLVEVTNSKRIAWPMARIEELLPGKDGEVRLARIKTKSGILLRPLQRLFPLEVDTSEFKYVPKKREEEPSTDITTEKIVSRQESRDVRKKKSKAVEETDAKSREDYAEVQTTRYGRVIRKPKTFYD